MTSNGKLEDLSIFTVTLKNDVGKRAVFSKTNLKPDVGEIEILDL
jgi:hypothetical protein